MPPSFRFVPDWAVQSLRSGMLLAGLMIVAQLSGLHAMTAPFCATCTLLALMPNAPFSAPRTVFLSHLLCIGTGALATTLLLSASPAFPALAVVLLAAWVSIMAMALSRAVHAPAVAHTVILSLGMQDTAAYATGALATAAGLALFSFVVSRSSGAKEPTS